MEMVDDCLGRGFRKVIPGITKAHQNDGDRRRLGGPHIDIAVAHHDRARGIAAGKADRPGQMARVGLCRRERIAPGNGAEIAFQLKLLEEP